MNKKKIGKEVYETPAITKYQIILEQVIAAGSPVSSSDGVTQEWAGEEEMNADYDVIIYR